MKNWVLKVFPFSIATLITPFATLFRELRGDRSPGFSVIDVVIGVVVGVIVIANVMPIAITALIGWDTSGYSTAQSNLAGLFPTLALLGVMVLIVSLVLKSRE